MYLRILRVVKKARTTGYTILTDGIEIVDGNQIKTFFRNWFKLSPRISIY
jgi:hypothetical protein